MLVSLTNLTVRCYPEKLEYVDRILAYAREKMEDFRER
jgi:vacuolar protein sorting-associated protein 35